MAYEPTGLITVAETGPFIRQAIKLWTDEDRHAFVDFIAADPNAGDIIPDTGGLRKSAGLGPGWASEVGQG